MKLYYDWLNFYIGSGFPLLLTELKKIEPNGLPTPIFRLENLKNGGIFRSWTNPSSYLVLSVKKSSFSWLVFGIFLKGDADPRNKWFLHLLFMKDRIQLVVIFAYPKPWWSFDSLRACSTFNGQYRCGYRSRLRIG